MKGKGLGRDLNDRLPVDCLRWITLAFSSNVNDDSKMVPKEVPRKYDTISMILRGNFGLSRLKGLQRPKARRNRLRLASEHG